MDFNQLFHQPSVRPYLMSARFGLEKESQRVDLKGNLAKTNHPATLGSRDFHPNIQTDFAETQVELITPVRTSIPEVLRQLAMLHDVIYRSMPKEEMLWPLSMPPALPESEDEIIIAKLTDQEVAYREYLAKVYGKRKQMVSGIHVNFEFAEELFRALFAEQNEWTDFEEFKTAVYLHVAQQYLHYRYIYTYFYGAAPYALDNYFTEDAPTQPVRSLRNSNYGYKNKEELKVSYRSFACYRQSLADLVAQGKLIAEKEFYSAVRLRQNRQVPDSASIQYIELRNVDLNPFEENGINAEQLTFLQAFLLFLCTKEKAEAVEDYIRAGEITNHTVAIEHPLATSSLQNELQSFMTAFKTFISDYQLPINPEYVANWESMVAHPELTLAGRLLTALNGRNQADWAVEVGLAYHQKAWAHPYQLAGYRGMELSTQILMFDAIQKGVQVEVLDEQDQFIQLTYQGKTEYVKKANMTSKDCYVVPLMMENKVVTKKILAKAGFNVPSGAEYHDFDLALADYEKYRQQAIVVKPKSTNYGLGITIFKEPFTQTDYREALAFAFKEDQDVLVERFIEGTEYRFFVINDQVQAIMLRVPANVIGDGVHTIRELVAQKNTDPLRGTHHRYPLEKIQLGEIEALNLKEQGYQFDDVLAKGQKVYLRENSNISTGGDSIDMTDAIGEDYKTIAVQAAKALGAEICGMDLIIPDYQQAASSPDAYAIIEANFNPAMHMHAYPYQGQGRRLTLSVLQLLFPDLTV